MKDVNFLFGRLILGRFPSPVLQAVVDSVVTVRKPGEPIDLYMVEIMEMKHKSETDTT